VKDGKSFPMHKGSDEDNVVRLFFHREPGGMRAG